MVQEKNWDNHVTCSSIDLSANAVKKKKSIFGSQSVHLKVWGHGLHLKLSTIALYVLAKRKQHSLNNTDIHINVCHLSIWSFVIINILIDQERDTQFVVNISVILSFPVILASPVKTNWKRNVNWMN